MAEPLNRLIGEFAKLPGIGAKSAQRLAFHILKTNDADVQSLIVALQDAKQHLKFCRDCGSFSTEELCNICSSVKRDRTKICVVQEPNDVLTLERGRDYKGLYHVLHGVISPMDGIGPDKIRLQELILRCQQEEVSEIIVATNPTVEGEATAMYISNLLKPAGINVTRLAYGLPVGGNLDFADDITLTKAMEHRRQM